MANPNVIADLYEIDEKIGAGGGGVVYLGRHLRLHKMIVLKADKRSLSAKEDALRREVDLLKNLTQTYIPQVYDFVQQDGVVYTVMDYIEGESLDKVLTSRGKLPQADIVKWSCQLLSALDYLHHQGEHGILHGDIKPANIMLRPKGDICLIDFNIALALGEDGAVKVGFSRGYASPEHYGAEYVRGRKLTEQSRKATSPIDEITEVTDMEKTQVDEEPVSFSAGSVTRSQPGVLLDARSDIYSLGATLYHLISGRRPAQNAEEVVPLGAQDCSLAVAEIINKAMKPDPSDRYQTAEEMLNAFLGLHGNDPRMIRHKRRMIGSAAALVMLFLAGGGCLFEGMQQKEQRQRALTQAEYSADLLAKGNVSGAIEEALQAIPEKKSIFTAPVTSQAQKALTDAVGVYNLSDGYKAWDVITIPAAPFDMELSPDGTRLAVVYGYEAAVYDLNTGDQLVAFPIQHSALADCRFVDDDHILYAAESGIMAYDISAESVVWSGEPATFVTLSGDRSKAACINGTDDRALIYDVTTGEKLTECLFDGRQLRVVANDILADPRENIFSLNNDGSFLAVSFVDGGITIFDLAAPEESLIVYDSSEATHFEGGFCGEYFAYTARNGVNNTFGLIDVEQGIRLGENNSQEPFYLQTDEQGIYLANANLLVKVQPDGQQLELAYTNNTDISKFSVGKEYIAVTCDDGTVAFYDSGAHLSSGEMLNNRSDFVLVGQDFAVIANRNEADLRIMKLERYENTTLFSYDARYEHEEARISQDGNTMMLFGIQGFRIYDRAGQLLEETEFPAADQVYDQQFHKEEGESYLEVVWYDGMTRTYSASDGKMLTEELRETPDKNLDEEFVTTDYRVESSLHSAPIVYDVKTGQKLAELESDGYLTYVTQTGNELITEYISTEGERYGLLLNDQFEVLAKMTNLCDVWNDSLILDFKSGNLRQSRLYSLQELIALGEDYIN